MGILVKLFNDDCLKILPTLPDKSINLILTDPPYATSACKWDSVIPFEPMWKELKRIIKDNGCIALFGSEPFSSALRMSNIKQFKYDWVWEKNNAGNFQLVNYQPLKIHETISIFYKITPNVQFSEIMKINMERLNLKQIDISKLQLSKNGNLTGWVVNKLNGSQLPTKEQWFNICELFGIENKYNEILKTVKGITYNLDLDEIDLECSNKGKAGRLGHLSSESKRYTYTQSKTGYPKSILRYNRDKNKLHPTQKPVALLEYLIKTYTNENDIVLDFTMGSGSTGVAAKNLNREFIGIESDKNYFDIAKNRIESTNQT